MLAVVQFVFYTATDLADLVDGYINCGDDQRIAGGVVGELVGSEGK
jgi:hypothetical protein